MEPACMVEVTSAARPAMSQRALKLFVAVTVALMLSIRHMSLRKSLLKAVTISRNRSEGKRNCRRNYHPPRRTQQNHSLQPCFSTTHFTLNNSSNSERDVRTNVRTNSVDVYLFIIESLGLTALYRDMPLTVEVLTRHNAIFFSNFQERQGGTRPNLVPLFFGVHNFTLHANSTCDVHISHSDYLKNSLWNVAKASGYSTLHGSTACNKMFGCDAVRTKDRVIFHNAHEKYIDFKHSFPYEAFYSREDNSNCLEFSEFKKIENILRCASRGPYHDKFFEYFKEFQSTQNLPLFTVTHLMETHGYFLAQALDFHTSHFLDWLLKQRSTLVIFMGDHLGDLSSKDSTALAIVPPPRHSALFKPLRTISDFMVVHEDIHRLLKSMLSSSNWKQAVTNFKRSILSNHCEMFQNLQRCVCMEGNTTDVAYSEDFKYIVLDFINLKRHNAVRCLEHRAEESRVENIQRHQYYLSFELHVSGGAIYEAMFQTESAFQVRQLTRYGSQVSCTPAEVHPEFCVCDEQIFQAAQVSKD